MISSIVTKFSLLNRITTQVCLALNKNNVIHLHTKKLYFFSDSTKYSSPRDLDSMIANEKQSRQKTPYRQQLNKYDEQQDQNRQLSQWKSPPKQSKQISIFFSQDQEGKLQIIQTLKLKEKIRQLSMIAKQMLFHPQTSQSEVIWCALEQAFITSLRPTKDQNTIRSVGKMLYALGKSKRATRNYETQVALLLPFSSHQSFTQIVTSISRMGGMSQEFGHIVEKLYWKRKEELNKLEVNLINYVLAKNGKKIDTQLIEHISSYPLRSIVMMLNSYDMSQSMTPETLKKCIPAIVARKAETNFLDLRGVINIYTKYLYLENEKLLQYIDEQYSILARNINQQGLEEIWEYFPQAVNANKLPISFVEQVVKSLKILRVRQRIGEKTWKKIALTFGKFQNLEIRTQLQKI